MFLDHGIANERNKDALSDGWLFNARLLAKDERLGSLESTVVPGLAFLAFQPDNQLLGRLGLLVENRLGLTTEPSLLPVVPALTLGVQGRLTLGRRTHTMGHVLPRVKKANHA